MTYQNLKIHCEKLKKLYDKVVDENLKLYKQNKDLIKEINKLKQELQK